MQTRSEFENILEQMLSKSQAFSNHSNCTQLSSGLNNAQILFMQNAKLSSLALSPYVKTGRNIKSTEPVIHFSELRESQKKAYTQLKYEGLQLNLSFSKTELTLKWREFLFSKHPDHNPTAQINLSNLKQAYLDLKEAFNPSQQAA